MQTDLAIPTNPTKELIYSRAEQFVKAWGDATNAERFMLAAANTINSEPDLLKCTDASKMSCLLQLCQWRLMPGKAMGHAFLVPFYNKDSKQTECTILIGYKGYCNLAYRSGLPSWIQTRVVYENDTFDYELGDSPFIKHKVSEKERGQRRGVYLVIQFKDGSKFVDYLPASEIAPVKDFALKNKKGFSPWQGAFEDEMWSKTIIRRDAKRLPLGELFEQAAAYEAEIETQEAAEQQPALPYPRKAVMLNASELQHSAGVIVGLVSEIKHDIKKKRDYNLYTLTLDNGTQMSFFDEGIADTAKQFHQSAESVLVEWQLDRYGPRVLHIAPYSMQDDTLDHDE